MLQDTALPTVDGGKGPGLCQTCRVQSWPPGASSPMSVGDVVDAGLQLWREAQEGQRLVRGNFGDTHLATAHQGR